MDGKEVNLKATLKEGTSTKTGKPYTYISVMLTETYEMKVFPNSAEQELLKTRKINR